MAPQSHLPFTLTLAALSLCILLWLAISRGSPGGTWSSPNAALSAALSRAAAAEAQLAALQATLSQRVLNGSSGGLGSRSGWPTARSDGYSSFECTGGSQTFTSGFTTQQTQAAYYPTAEAPILRLCLLRDVCFSPTGELLYYSNPELERETLPHLRLSAFGAQPGGLAKLDYFLAHFGQAYSEGSPYNTEFVPRVVPGPRPDTLPFHSGPAAVHAFSRLSFANNWGHLWVDTILPALAAADIFGFAHADLQLLDMYSCDTMYNAGYGLPFVPGQTHADVCKENMARWLQPLFSHPLLSFPAYASTCYHQLLVGHGGALGLSSLFHHRAATVRAARERLHAALGVPQPPLASHSILVLLKTPQSNAAGIADLCAVVQLAAARVRQAGAAPVPVQCLEPTLLAAREQLAAIGGHTLLVAENGSTGYMAMLQRPGSSFISVLGSLENVAKEPQVLLSLTDVQVFYTSLADLGPGTVLLALERAGVRLGLPQAVLAAAAAPQ